MNLFRGILIPIFSLLIASISYADDLGTIGDVYAIRENDLLSVLQSRVQSIQMNGQWQTIQNEMQKRAQGYRDRPHPIAGISRASESKTWLFDPSITLSHDVISPDGRRLALAGTHINPLNTIKLTKTLIFIDGDDNSQLSWLINQIRELKKTVKVILVRGSLLNIEKAIHQPIYFDQGGRLVSKFNIKHVPASVSQQGDRLKISEIVV